MGKDLSVKQVLAVRAAIVKDKRVLIIRESGAYEDGTNEGSYDMPGGRVDAGESIHDALKREVREEVGVNIEILKPFFVGEWRPVVKDTKLQIIGIFFLCSTKDVPRVGDDHDDFQWISAEEAARFSIVSPVPEVIKILIAEGAL